MTRYVYEEVPREIMNEICFEARRGLDLSKDCVIFEGGSGRYHVCHVGFFESCEIEPTIAGMKKKKIEHWKTEISHEGGTLRYTRHIVPAR